MYLVASKYALNNYFCPPQKYLKTCHFQVLKYFRKKLSVLFVLKRALNVICIEYI